jgi:PBSX family phage terminase large subunit
MTAKPAPFRFQPFSTKQKKVLTWWMEPSPYKDHDIIVCDGAVRSGKTIAMIDGFTSWTQSEFHDQLFILSGKTVEAFKRNVIRPMTQILTAKGIKHQHNRAEHYIEVGSNVYYYFGANTEASQDVIQGVTAAGAFGDEVALFPQSFVEQMMARCSVDGAKLWFNCNPEGPYHYVKADLIDKADEKNVLHLHFTMEDNLTLSAKRRAFYERMYSGLWYRRYVLGEWVAAEGAIYDMWEENVHIVKEAPPLTRYSIGIDYGTGNPTVFLLAGETPKGDVYIIAEYYYDGRAKAKQKTDSEYSADLKEFLAECQVHPWAIVYDPSAASFGAQMRKDGLGPLRQADNSVLDGIRTVSSRLQQRRLFVHESCTNLIREMQTYVWDDKAAERGEDKPVKQNDHACDALRYIMQTLYRRR